MTQMRTITTTIFTDTDCDTIIDELDCDADDSTVINTNENDADCDTIDSEIDCNDEDAEVTNTNKKMMMTATYLLTTLIVMMKMHPSIKINLDEWYDGIDSNCGGDDDYDQDQDGFISEEYADLSSLQVGDCDDLNSDINIDANGVLV